MTRSGDGEDVGARPLIERKARLAALLSGVAPPLHYSDYHRGQGPALHEQACKLELEGIVSKRDDAAYAPGNRVRPQPVIQPRVSRTLSRRRARRLARVSIAAAPWFGQRARPLGAPRRGRR
jgi:hypothetical protein